LVAASGIIYRKFWRWARSRGGYCRLNVAVCVAVILIGLSRFELYHLLKYCLDVI